MPAPTLRLRAIGTAFAVTGLLALSIAATAAAKPKTTPGDLRVVAPTGKTLAEHTQYTSTTKIKTSRRADCFGQGTGGSGEKVTIPGPTALGIIDDGIRADRDLKPLSISDHFDFGVVLCGVGGFTAPQTGFWYLKVNHAASQLGGDQTEVSKGDEILWFLIDDFNEPVPPELALKAPAYVAPNARYRVKVVEYSDGGKRSRAEGATVSGVGTTGSDGRASGSGRGLFELVATREGSIPSNTVTVCARPKRSDCPPGYAKTIAGSSKADRIVGSGASETILAGGGDDKIDIRRGKGVDLVKCGAGKDRLIVSRGQEFEARSCERVVRR